MSGEPNGGAAGAGAGAPNGGAPNAGAGGAAGGDGGQQQPWYSSIQDEGLRGYAELKGFKDPSAVLDSYRNFEKLHGVPQDRLLKLPEKADDPSWSQIFERLGRPKEAKEYSIPLPEGVKESPFTEATKQKFFELGLSRTQAEKLSSWYNEQVGATEQAKTQEYQANIQKQSEELKTKWGAAYEQNIQLGREFVKQAGLDGPTIDALENAMGFGKVMELMHSLGTKIGEGQFVRGNNDGSGGFNGGRVLSPAAAKERIAQLSKDQSFVKRFTSGDVDAKAEMDRLNRWAIGMTS